MHAHTHANTESHTHARARAHARTHARTHAHTHIMFIIILFLRFYVHLYGSCQARCVHPFSVKYCHIEVTAAIIIIIVIIIIIIIQEQHVPYCSERMNPKDDSSPLPSQWFRHVASVDRSNRNNIWFASSSCHPHPWRRSADTLLTLPTAAAESWRK